MKGKWRGENRCKLCKAALLTRGILFDANIVPSLQRKLQGKNGMLPASLQQNWIVKNDRWLVFWLQCHPGTFPTGELKCPSTILELAEDGNGVKHVVPLAILYPAQSLHSQDFIFQGHEWKCLTDFIHPEAALRQCQN